MTITTRTTLALETRDMFVTVQAPDGSNMHSANCNTRYER
jgi:hypothetical protein